MRKIQFTCGNKYVLDADFNNSSIVVVHYVGLVYATVSHPDTPDNKWDVMINRLSEIKNK